MAAATTNITTATTAAANVTAPTKKDQRKVVHEIEVGRKMKQAQLNAENRETHKNEPQKTQNSCTTNRCCQLETTEQEHEERTVTVVEQVRIISQQLPTMLKRLSKIADPRQIKKVKHGIASLMVYGILCFVLQISSRREANGKLTWPQIKENLLTLFPDLKTLPHADTLFRLLRDMGENVQEIELALIDLVGKLIRRKKFKRFLINNCYPIAIDGSRKVTFSGLWSEGLLQQRISGSEENGDAEYQYYIYVLEASICLHNGMVIPLMSEFLDFREGDVDRNKQDCETRAFHRLAERIKKAFPRLPIMLLLDGLYAQGPVMECCLNYNWQFMIVLKDGSLPTMWDEYRGLLPFEPKNVHRQPWNERKQCFRWVNNIRYEYGDNKHLTVNVVVCNEQWQEINKNAEKITIESKHAWLSSNPLRRENVHERCNLGGRYRWGIEAGFLVEKHQGYQYEHSFAKDWNAMRGYHYLMRIGHLLNTLARYSSTLAKKFSEMSVRGCIDFIRVSLSGPWFDLKTIQNRICLPFELCLI
ncbi:MAG: transposase family protein [Rhodospirillaceae bacterium]